MPKGLRYCSMARTVKEDVDEIPTRFTGPAMIELHPVCCLLRAKSIRGSQLQPLTYIGSKLRCIRRHGVGDRNRA